MKIAIKTKDIKLTPDLKELIEKKIGTLEKYSGILKKKDYFDDFLEKGKERVIAEVEIGKETRGAKTGAFFRAECQIGLPQKTLRAEAVSEDLEQAINEIRDELKIQIKKHKEKRVNE